MAKVDIWNMALIRLGAETVTSPTDTKKGAVILSQIYDGILDEMLQEHNWNFAVKRAELTQNPTDPVFDYTYSYNLPADCLQPLSINSAYPWHIEADQLVTSASSVKLRYIARITDTGEFPPLFAQALALRLAYHSCYSLTRDGGSIMQFLTKEYETILNRAKVRDAQAAGKDTFNIDDPYF